jgi:Tn7-like transposition protein D/TniQ
MQDTSSQSRNIFNLIFYVSRSLHVIKMPLGFFTDPLPDELLYSACARFSEQSRYPNALDALHDLFGNQKISAMVDFPNRLDKLISSLPPGHRYTADRFIEENTLFPFYAPFLHPERAQIVRNEMKVEGDNHIRARLGIAAARIPLPARLRYCPKCVIDDREKYKKTYWHRNHQITGVEVCFTHAVFLESSFIPWQGRGHASSRFHSAEEAVSNTSPRPTDLDNRKHSFFLSIARNAAWLLSQRELLLGSRVLRDRYYNLLLKRGYAYYNGRIRTTELLNEFIQFYSNEFLSSIHCPINSGGHSWVIRLLLKDKVNVVQPPLRHLLLLIFLEHTAEQIFTSISEYKPFGDGPWSCLNHAAHHFQQSIVTKCRITDCLIKKKHGRPMGTFTCKCGLVYHRIGPDHSTEDRFCTSSIQSYGPIWERSLQKLWDDTGRPLRDVGQRLGVSELTIIRHAIRLGLPMNSPGARQVNGYERYRSYRRTMQEALSHYRTEWLTIRKSNPKATRKQLIAIASFLYLWLRKNDSVWIEKHLPKVNKPNRRIKRIDWKNEDRKLAAALKVAAQKIKNLPGRPMRASITAILKEIGHRAWVERRLTDLPLTAKAIQLHIESLESYTIRKVIWAEQSFHLEGLSPTRHQLMTRAVIRNKTGSTPAVQSAIDASMERLGR